MDQTVPLPSSLVEVESVRHPFPRVSLREQKGIYGCPSSPYTSLTTRLAVDLLTVRPAHCTHKHCHGSGDSAAPAKVTSRMATRTNSPRSACEERIRRPDQVFRSSHNHHQAQYRKVRGAWRHTCPCCPWTTLTSLVPAPHCPRMMPVNCFGTCYGGWPLRLATAPASCRPRSSARPSSPSSSTFQLCGQTASRACSCLFVPATQFHMRTLKVHRLLPTSWLAWTGVSCALPCGLSTISSQMSARQT